MRSYATQTIAMRINTLLDLAGKASGHSGYSELLPSAHWLEVLRRFHQKAFTECRSEDEIVSFATENNGFVIYRYLESDFLNPVLDAYLNWLDRNGYPLENMQENIEESPLASQRITCVRRGRSVSTSFLWHLCAALRIESLIPDLRTVIEIGAGFGGLVRILKLLREDRKFILVDLPETLAFVYIYLSRHFPKASILFLSEKEPLPTNWDDLYDFVLIPSNLIDSIHGVSLDLAVNIASFGEMTSKACKKYASFIENDMSVKYLYSINQYGCFPPELAKKRGKRLTGSDICSVALPVDAYWRLCCWNFLESDGFIQADPLMAPSLEVLLRRIPNAERTSTDNVALGRKLTDEASQFPEGSNEWHMRLWDAARLDPSGTGARLLQVWGKSNNFPEFIS